ncbi:MAG: helix-turn-helix transcriptional regulator [Thermoguttaceae bacterium]|nr:helix-turn-helix transcriptional regulator [Thermoguttaceae bacterium]
MSTPSIPSIPITTGVMTGYVCPAPVVPAKEVKKVRPEQAKRTFHQIAQVRESQGMSIQNCARKLGIPLQEAREQEKPTSDLTISQLIAWKEVLDVPLSELVGPFEDELQNPIRNRAKLLKVMKSAKYIHQHTRESRIRTMAENQIDQILEIVPEFETVSPWPEVGQSHEARQPGVAVSRRFDPEIERRLDP